MGRQKDKNTENIITDIGNTVRKSKVCVIRVPEGEDRENKTKTIFEEIMAEDFLKLIKHIKPHI